MTKNKILVSGVVNLETTLKVGGFPLKYEPVRYAFGGVNSTIAGVGFNIAKALATLDNEVVLVGFIGNDDVGQFLQLMLPRLGVNTTFLLPLLEASPQSVILFEQRDQASRRQINTDLKDLQSLEYPPEVFEKALGGCSLAVLTNINFSRLLLPLARAKGVPIATDVQVISDLEDEYNQDFMEATNILFMSDAELPSPPRVWVDALWKRYKTDIVVIGMGSKGAYLGVRKDAFCGLVKPPEGLLAEIEVKSTVGAGDALFACFNHVYSTTKNPYKALKKAVIFAAKKVDSIGAAQGFLREQELESLVAQFPVDLKPQ